MRIRASLQEQKMISMEQQHLQHQQQQHLLQQHHQHQLQASNTPLSSSPYSHPHHSVPPPQPVPGQKTPAKIDIHSTLLPLATAASNSHNEGIPQTSPDSMMHQMAMTQKGVIPQQMLQTANNHRQSPSKINQIMSETKKFNSEMYKNVVTQLDNDMGESSSDLVDNTDRHESSSQKPLLQRMISAPGFISINIYIYINIYKFIS